VLVVEDDAETGAHVAEVLAVAGHATLLAHDGEEALQLARRHHVDAVLLDWDLPGELMGVPLVGALRRAAGVAIPIIVCADPRAFEEARLAAPDGLLSKPFSYRALIDSMG
jgi:DNA-binding response OmpR family regulator